MYLNFWEKNKTLENFTKYVFSYRNNIYVNFNNDQVFKFTNFLLSTENYVTIINRVST